LQPKDSGDEASSDIKTNIDMANDVLKYILEEIGLKSMIFNLEDIKAKIDADSKGPY